MEGTFWQLVARAAAEAPDREVLRDDHGRSLTNATYRDAAEEVAAGLLAQGIGPGDTVSWQLPTVLEAPVLMAACARLGVRQNPIIPILREREVRLITSQVDAAVLVVPRFWRGFDHSAMAASVGVRALVVDLEGEVGPGMRLRTGDVATLPPPPADEPGACRWVYYSSGTTADPKGGRHSDASVMSSSNGMVELLGLGDGDVYPIAWPFTHIGGIAMLSSVLRAGGVLVLFDSFDPATTGEAMAAHRPTILGSAPPFFRVYLDAQRRHGDDPLFPHLRACTGGGAPIPVEINRELVEAFGIPGVVCSWGLTEFPVASCEAFGDPEVGTTVGYPTDGVSYRIVDGEIRLKGPQCFLGYVDASLDEEAFDTEGWFRTGDLAEVDGRGRIRITGRSKDVIIRNAENISALEVEDALLSHPDVLDVAVIGLPDERTGERVCALVVPAAGAELDVAALGAHCLARGLARQKCPEQVVVVDELARNPMGKVLKQQYRDELAAG